MKKKLFNIFLSILLLFTFVTGTQLVNAAGDPTYVINGDSTVDTGATFTETVRISGLSASKATNSWNGAITVSDSTCISIVSETGKNSTNSTGGRFIGFSFSSSSSDFDVVELSMQAGSSPCTATISIDENVIALDDGTSSEPSTITKTITVKAPTPKSTDATLSALSITGQTISPTFTSTNETYSLTVPYSVSSVTVNATKNDSKASLTGTGSKNLSVGNNPLKVVVTAEDGVTKKTYTINVTREAAPVLSTDATLSNLEVSGYTISPAFTSANETYTLTVPNDATSVTVLPTKNDSKASYVITGNTGLSVGSNAVKVVVTAEDGVTKKTYTINVTREAASSTPEPEKSSDADLKSLTVTGYTITPAFDKDVTSYSMTVENSVTSITAVGVANDSKAKSVTVTGATGLVVGVNPVKVTVIAEDGTEKIYTINVTRKAADSGSGGGTGSGGGSGGGTGTGTGTGSGGGTGTGTGTGGGTGTGSGGGSGGGTGTTTTTPKSSNSYLKEISTVNGDLNPVFSSTRSNYSITVPYEVDKLDLTTLTSDSKAKVKVTGNSNFKVGKVNVVEIEVTAEDGSSRSYTINVTRSPKNSKTKIEDIGISGLSPKFDPDVYE